MYGYNIIVQPGWNVIAPENSTLSSLSANKILYGVTLIDNFDLAVAETQGDKPEDLKIQIGLGPMANSDFSDWIQNRVWDETESPDFIDFNYQSTNPVPISLGSLNGYTFVIKIDLLVKSDVVVSIGLSPSNSTSIPSAGVPKGKVI